MTHRALLVLGLVGALGTGVAAQEHTTPAAAPATPTAQQPAPASKPLGPSDILLPHLVDSKHLEVPCFHGWSDQRADDGKFHAAWGCAVHLPVWNVHIGSKTIDFGPTKHTVWLFISAVVVATMMIFTARAHRRHSHAAGHPKGFAAAIEAIVLYLRNVVYVPALGGHGGEKYAPFCLTLFFFILVCNFFGLIPYGSTATGNLAVTGGLALITFIVIEVAGMRALGKGYIGTIVYWPHDMPFFMKLGLTLIMTPIEIISKFTKPFALTIRLFANMVAGHVIILSLVGLIFLFGWAVAIPVLGMSMFIMGLETLIVVPIQAFIFSLLAAVFIGQIRTAHH
jgi:F-type H+-transporting ATPase subunit a